uniref:Translation initiation factor IF-2 n=1 Tax=Panagrellus redivivus TaxID=6233 RepID=A0A7E4VTF2_PANRE
MRLFLVVGLTCLLAVYIHGWPYPQGGPPPPNPAPGGPPPPNPAPGGPPPPNPAPGGPPPPNPAPAGPPPYKKATAWPANIFESAQLGQDAKITGDVYSVNGEKLSEALGNAIEKKKASDLIRPNGGASGK